MHGINDNVKCVQYIVLMFLHVSATNRNNLQVATVLEERCSVLCNLPDVPC